MGETFPSLCVTYSLHSTFDYLDCNIDSLCILLSDVIRQHSGDTSPLLSPYQQSPTWAVSRLEPEVDKRLLLVTRRGFHSSAHSQRMTIQKHRAVVFNVEVHYVCISSVFSLQDDIFFFLIRRQRRHGRVHSCWPIAPEFKDVSMSTLFQLPRFRSTKRFCWERLVQRFPCTRVTA